MYTQCTHVDVNEIRLYKDKDGEDYIKLHTPVAPPGKRGRKGGDGSGILKEASALFTGSLLVPAPLETQVTIRVKATSRSRPADMPVEGDRQKTNTLCLSSSENG